MTGAADAPAAAAPAFPWHAHTVDECLSVAECADAVGGLTPDEAARRLAEHGPNALTPPPRTGFLLKLWAQVNNSIVYILIAAVIVAGALRDWAEVALISLVVIINIAIGLHQEGKAEKAADALNSMLAPRCTVVRGGVRMAAEATALVVGDIVFVQSGDKVPADLRLLSCTDLQVLESMLTGESLAVTKVTVPAAVAVGLGDRKCMAFSATLVQQGQGLGLVVATGDASAIGTINALVQGEPEKPSALQVQLEVFGRWISIITILIAIAGFLLSYFYVGAYWGESFNSAVAIAVAIIPEGLPSVVTITLALGVSKMAREHAIVRKLPAVETLGAVSTVCSDKTGTLTKNEMTAVAFVTAAAHYPVTGVGYSPEEGELCAPDGAPLDAARGEALRAMLLSAVLPNDGGLSRADAPATGWVISGDPTDVAPLVLFNKAGGDFRASQGAYVKAAVLPFESLHKWQGVLVQDAAAAGGRVLHLKGAPERLLPLCSHAVAGDNIAAPPAPIDAAFWSAAAAALSSKGLRVLAVARWAPPADWDVAQLSVAWVSAQPPFLTLVGLIAILDPPRPECIAAIQQFHAAGIVVKMITGDHPKTALAIGCALGLAEPNGIVYTGPEVDALTDAALAKAVLECNVYARSSPENKIRIVKALQSHGQIVSMTGDGVNDAPSLKAANIGVAMGITGTDVSKEAAKIVLSDDNFATIVCAVEEGRRVWDNLRKIFLFNLPTNFAQGMVVFFSFVINEKEAPLTPIQVLFVNLIISVTLGGAIAFEDAEEGIMTRKPRRASKPLVGKHILFRTLWVTSAMVVFLLLIFTWALNVQHMVVGQARACVFTLLVVSSVFYALNCRSSHEFALGRSFVRPNPIFFINSAIVIILQCIIVHVAPINQFFSCFEDEIEKGQCAPMGALEWGPIMGFSALLFAAVEAEKAFAPTIYGGFLKPCVGAVFSAFKPLTSWCSFSAAYKAADEGRLVFIASSASSHGIALGANAHAGLIGPRPFVPKTPSGRFSAASLRAKGISARSASARLLEGGKGVSEVRPPTLQRSVTAPITAVAV